MANWDIYIFVCKIEDWDHMWMCNQTIHIKIDPISVNFEVLWNTMMQNYILSILFFLTLASFFTDVMVTHCFVEDFFLTNKKMCD